MFERSRDGDVFILQMTNGQNLMDPDFFQAFEEMLDAIEAESEGDAGLVLTGMGKYFCTGLNLEVVSRFSREEYAVLGATLMRVFGRLLTFPVPTVAALNGHAFAGGSMLAACCDYRVMREDRGFICVSEIDAGLPIDPKLVRLLGAKLPPATVRTAVLSGHRFDGPEALEAGWVDALAKESDLMTTSTQQARALASKPRRIYGSVKWATWGALAEELGHERRSRARSPVLPETQSGERHA